MINIISPINQLGYGIAGLNIVSNLPSVSLWPIGQIQITNEDDANILRRCLKNAQFPDFNAPCVRIWHQNDMSQFVGRGTKIGFPFFELDEFTQVEKHHLNSLDRLFVSSFWAKSVAESQLDLSSENIFVVPLGVNSKIFQPSLNTGEKTIFFNCGKWEIRKGHDILIEAFNKAFTEKDNVELWMMCSNPFLNPEQSSEWAKLYQNSSLGHKIKLIDRKNTQEEVYNIMKQTDCGVFPARAEGWNLELLEMMACGKHVIATNYSAHTEFCNADNANLIEIEAKEVAYDGIWFHGQTGKWAAMKENQLDQLISHMRSIHKLKQDNLLKLNYSAIQTSHQFSWKNTAEMVIKYV
jgi:glycosyltransferase involved in cell wall biosynthesis